MVAQPFTWHRLIPVLIVLTVVVTFFVLDLGRYLRIETLRQQQHTLHAWVETSGVLAAGIFMVGYISTVALSLPGATMLSIASGFLFGAIWGTAVAVVSATLGGTVLFVIAKTTCGDALRTRAGAWLRTLEAGFRAHALSYLIVLRLAPILPFFVVNLVPAFLGVPLATFVLGTFVGIIPGSFVYASVGAGLGSIFAAGGTVSLTEVLTPQIILALVGLAGLALVPMVYKKIRARPVESAPLLKPPVS